MTPSQTASQVLSEFAPAAGLSPVVAPFSGRLADGSRPPLAQSLAEHPLLMAPMAGVTDAAYRLMARAGGACLAYSEMVSCAGLHYGEKSWELALPAPEEPDLAVQLFGTRPELFSESASRLVERMGDRLALIDVNMACPAPKVVRKGEGSALMDEPALAASLVRACVDAAPGVPVTVKIRRGRRMGEECAPEFARAMADAGASAVAVHGRFADQMYHGQADWGVIDRVADAAGVPVIGSGDVEGPDAAARMLSQTAATAVMVARGSYGDPWAFSRARALLAGSADRVPTDVERVRAFACHVRLLEATGAHLKRARSLSGWFFRGMPDAGRWRAEAMACSTAGEFLDVAERLLVALGERRA